MRYTEPICYLYNVLYRPGRAMVWLDTGRRALALAHALTLGVLVCSELLIWLVGRPLLGIDLLGMAQGWVDAWTLAVPATVICFLLLCSGRDYSPAMALAFAWSFCALVMLLPMSLLLGTLDSVAFARLQTSLALIILILFLFGVMIGKMVAVIVVLHPQRRSSAVVRWMLVGAAMGLALLQWWLPFLRQTPSILSVPALVGLAIGVSQPLSYLVEAAASLVLLVVARWNVPADRVLAFHPILYDHMSLLPLPGLRSLLRQSCRADAARGQRWLLLADQHVGQGHAARATLERIVREKVCAHAVLLALSTSPEGAAFLARQAQRWGRSHRLIADYAALAAVSAPAAWPGTIEQHGQAFAQARVYPGGTGIAAFLLTGAATLRAERWAVALDALHGQAVDHDRLGRAVIALRAWANSLPLVVGEHKPRLAQLANDLPVLDGWPAALVAAMSEHLLFLRAIEQRRVSLGINALEQENLC